MGSQILRTAFLFVLSGWINLSGQNVEYLIEDAAALNTFYNSLGGSNWDSKSGWPVEEEPKDTKSTPYGVSLIEIDTIQVNDTLIRIKYKTEKIDLHDNGLTGQASAVTFDELIELNLYSNDITGFSSGFSGPELVMVNLQSNEINRWGDVSLPNLEVLNLNYNDLTNMIGSSLYPKLEYLYLNYNQITNLGLLNFPALKEIRMEYNQLSSSLPNLDLPNLEFLMLSGNSLTSSLPSLNLPKLIVLDVGGSNLSGSIPNLNFPELEVLNLGGNEFSGTLPLFEGLTNLKELIVSSNNLCGPLPSSFGFDATIEHIALGGGENAFSGAIPAYAFPNALSFSLEGLDLQLEGELPMFDMPKLKSLNLRNNHRITGSLMDLRRLSWMSIYLERRARLPLSRT